MRLGQTTSDKPDGREDMTSSLGGDTPAVARQRVRGELRRARRKTDFTQTEVATRLGWSLSKVQRIEIGEVAVSETDLRALLDLYGVTAADIVGTLVEDARLARRERWVTDPEHRKYLPSGLRRLLQFEVVATQIRAYQALLLPGFLQTAAMAKYIVDEVGGITEEERRVRFEVRMSRRKAVIERPDGPRYYVVIDESVLWRNLGGSRLMADQLEDLLEVATNPRMFVRVMPRWRSRGAIIGTLGNFMLLNLSDEDADDSVLYRERVSADDIDHDLEKISPYRDAFEKLWELSLPEDATLRLIRLYALKLRVEQDRPPTVDE
jgi:transcriptional regulator with XRE-family HTH domain